MTDLANLEPDALFSRQRELWGKQADYVARRSAFYQRLWQGRKPPSDLADIADLPLSSKAELRASQAAAPPFGDYLAADSDSVNRLHRTSGTTGQAMNLALSRRDCEIT